MWLNGSEFACQAGDVDLIPGSGKIPWTEDPGRPQPMGLQRVRHDLATNQQQNILSLQIVNNKVLIFQSIQKTHFLVIFPVFRFSVSNGSIIENYIK